MFAIRARKKAISEKDFLKAIEKIKYDSRFSATEKYKVYN
jgi:26S proteasome regulatory subunit T1